MSDWQEMGDCLLPMPATMTSNSEVCPIRTEQQQATAPAISSLPMPVAPASFSLTSLPLPQAGKHEADDQLKSILEYEFKQRKQMNGEQAVDYIHLMTVIGETLGADEATILKRTIAGLKLQAKLSPLNLQSMAELQTIVKALMLNEQLLSGKLTNGGKPKSEECRGCGWKMADGLHCYRCHAEGHMSYRCPVEKKLDLGDSPKIAWAYGLTHPLVSQAWATTLNEKPTAIKGKQMVSVPHGAIKHWSIVVKEQKEDLILPL